MLRFGGGAGYVPEHERMWETLEAERWTAFLFLGDNVHPIVRYGIKSIDREQVFSMTL